MKHLCLASNSPQIEHDYFRQFLWMCLSHFSLRDDRGQRQICKQKIHFCSENSTKIRHSSLRESNESNEFEHTSQDQMELAISQWCQREHRAVFSECAALHRIRQVQRQQHTLSVHPKMMSRPNNYVQPTPHFDEIIWCQTHSIGSLFTVRLFIWNKFQNNTQKWNRPCKRESECLSLCAFEMWSVIRLWHFETWRLTFTRMLNSTSNCRVYQNRTHQNLSTATTLGIVRSNWNRFMQRLPAVAFECFCFTVNRAIDGENHEISCTNAMRLWFWTCMISRCRRATVECAEWENDAVVHVEISFYFNKKYTGNSYTWINSSTTGWYTSNEFFTESIIVFQ